MLPLRASAAGLVELDVEVPPGRPALLLDDFLRANQAPAGIGLGTAVLVSQAGGRARAAMTWEGVVIEVVPPGGRIRSTEVVYPRSVCANRSAVVRYVVQCRTCRVLRWAAELAVVSR